MFLQKECTDNLEWFKSLTQTLGCLSAKKDDPLLYSPPETKSTDYVTVEFFCLLAVEQWKFEDNTSKVYLRFTANHLGTFHTCHGPMCPTNKGNNKRFVTL